MNIHVGNLPFKMSEAELSELFGAHGKVTSAKIIIDKMSGRSKGFAFVEMEDDAAGNNAIADLNGKDFQGRAIRVSEARPRE